MKLHGRTRRLAAVAGVAIVAGLTVITTQGDNAGAAARSAGVAPTSYPWVPQTTTTFRGTTPPTTPPNPAANAGWLAYTTDTGGGIRLAVKHDRSPLDCGGFGCYIPFSQPVEATQASWSPDGTRLVFAAKFDGNFDIWSSNESGSGLKQLTKTKAPTQNASPSFTPDGGKILFTQTNRKGNADIYAMTSNGKSVKRLTTDAKWDDQAVMAPNGSIAFTTNRNGNSDIYLMDADGKNQRKFVATRVPERDPDWLSNGSMLAFTDGERNVSTVRIVKANGSFVTWFGSFEESFSHPTFSPDGSRIAVIRDTWGQIQRLVTMRLDGSDRRFLASGTTLSDPDWQPVP